MKDVNCVGVGYSDETPTFVFEVEMREGRDFDGVFDIAFALAEIGDEKRFAVLQGFEQNVIAHIKHEYSMELIESLLDAKQYLVVVNYENTEYEIDDGIVIPLLGRVKGESFDWVNRTELPDSHITALQEMKQFLK